MTSEQARHTLRDYAKSVQEEAAKEWAGMKKEDKEEPYYPPGSAGARMQEQINKHIPQPKNTLSNADRDNLAKALSGAYPSDLFSNLKTSELKEDKPQPKEREPMLHKYLFGTAIGTFIAYYWGLIVTYATTSITAVTAVIAFIVAKATDAPVPTFGVACVFLGILHLYGGNVRSALYRWLKIQERK